MRPYRSKIIYAGPPMCPNCIELPYEHLMTVYLTFTGMRAYICRKCKITAKWSNHIDRAEDNFLGRIKASKTQLASMNRKHEEGTLFYKTFIQ